MNLQRHSDRAVKGAVRKTIVRGTWFDSRSNYFQPWDFIYCIKWKNKVNMLDGLKDKALLK